MSLPPITEQTACLEVSTRRKQMSGRTGEKATAANQPRDFDSPPLQRLGNEGVEQRG
jgi:hypothetical protein